VAEAEKEKDRASEASQGIEWLSLPSNGSAQLILRMQ